MHACMHDIAKILDVLLSENVNLNALHHYMNPIWNISPPH